MSKKIYDEEYINNTALAIKDLTGVEGQFRLCDIPGILHTYKYPKDMTNVRKIKITFRSSFPWSTSGMGLGSIRFKSSSSNEYYQYVAQDIGECSVRVNYGSVNDIMNNTTIKNCQMLWSDIGTLPLSMTITFGNGIDLTNYDILELYPDLNKVAYGPPAVIDISVLTGDPDESPEVYTELYKGLNLTDVWVYNTLNPVFIDVVKDNKYRYIKMIVRDTRRHDLQDIRWTSILFSYKDSEDVSHYLAYNGSEIGSTNGTADYGDVSIPKLLARSEFSGEPVDSCYIDQDVSDPNYPYIIIDLYGRTVDLNVYNHLRLTNSGDGYNTGKLPLYVDLLLAKEPTFSVPKIILNNVTLFTGDTYYNTTLYDIDI